MGCRRVTGPTTGSRRPCCSRRWHRRFRRSRSSPPPGWPASTTARSWPRCRVPRSPSCWPRSGTGTGRSPRSTSAVIRVQLSDVDYESIVERAKTEDNDGRRRELLKDLVREALLLQTRDGDVFGVHSQSVVWRGSRREVDVVFGNVRDTSWLTEDHFRARPRSWRLVVDFPFDERGRSAAEPGSGPR